MTSRSYSTKFKENALKQLLLPGSPGLSATAGKIGIAPSTLFGWKKVIKSIEIRLL